MVSSTDSSQFSSEIKTDALSTPSLNNQASALFQSNSSNLLQDPIQGHLQWFHSSFSLDRPSLSLGSWTLPALDQGVVNLSAVSALTPGVYQVQAVAYSTNGETFISNTQLLQTSSSTSSSSNWQFTQTAGTELPVPLTPQMPDGLSLNPYDSAALNQVIQGAIANALQTNQGLVLQITLQGQDWLAQGARLQAQLEQIIQDIYANVPQVS